MIARPDYERLKKERSFGWHVGSTAYALMALTGTSLGEYNLKPEACIEVYRKGRPRFRELFPNADDVPLPGVYTPPISYGHVNGLGSELLFPEEGEVAHTHIYGSLEEGIKALRQPVDFARAGMAPFYLEFKRRLEQAFPGERVGFAYKLEGPITTAYELRGEGVFYDLMDKPDLTKQFLSLSTQSINEFWRFLAGVNGAPVINPAGGGMCDDVSSMVPPRMFEEFVIPYWDEFFRGRTTGPRQAHVEDLRAAQLRYLEVIGLSSYDPSISPQLNPQIVAAHCRVPFAWRLGSFHYRDMSCRDVEDFVFQSAADGAARVITHIEATLCTEPGGVEKVEAFIRAGKEAQRLVADGCGREELAQRVSAENRGRFWQQWTGYKG